MDIPKTPDFADIALMLHRASRADGRLVDVAKVVVDYQYHLAVFMSALRKGETFPADYRFFVPDLWHVAKGRAQDLPTEEGNRLYEAQCLGIRLATEYLERVYSQPLAEKNGYPGALFKPRRCG